MHYAIRHITKFAYSVPITESLTEVRMQPLTDGRQTCRSFELTINPRARVVAHSDHLGNVVHHFDVPRPHTNLLIGAKSKVEVLRMTDLPLQLEISAWDELDAIVENGDYDEMLLPSRFATCSNMLMDLAKELDVRRRNDPLTVLSDLNTGIYRAFDYVPQSTMVDSPIDDALRERKGVCQDYSHIMITLLREVLQVPARYVSGYLFHRVEDKDRSATDATHAWVEALLPGLGWIGFDPTNDLVAGDRHIRVGVGRDYADVPPTRGVFKGEADSELSVAVQVNPAEVPVQEMKPVTISTWSPPDVEERTYVENQRLQQQQQQQQ